MPARRCIADLIRRDEQVQGPALTVADGVQLGVHAPFGSDQLGVIRRCPRTIYGWPLGKSVVRFRHSIGRGHVYGISSAAWSAARPDKVR